MNNEMKKDALTEEELNKVSGGTWTPFNPGKIDLSGLVVDRTIPDYCTPIHACITTAHWTAIRSTLPFQMHLTHPVSLSLTMPQPERPR